MRRYPDSAIRFDEWQTAQSLHDVGLVHSVAPPEQLQMQAGRLAVHLSRIDPADALAGGNPWARMVRSENDPDGKCRFSMPR